MVTPPPRGETEIYRWLGTPAAASELHFAPGTGEKASATFHAMPVEDGITADVRFNGEHTAHVDFGPRDPRTYTVSLQPET